MKRLFAVFISLFFLFSIAEAQTEQQALKILDTFSNNAQSAPSVSFSFDVVIFNQPEKRTDTISGSLLFSGNRYRLTLPDNIIFFDGTNSWSYLPAEKEVSITKPDKDDDSFMGDPSSIFKMYRNGYKSRLIGENADSYTVDLYPEDIKDDIIRIRLVIGKNQYDLRSAEYKRRDGITNTLYVKDFDLKQKPAPASFTFQKEKYKGVEIIDMRAP